MKKLLIILAMITIMFSYNFEVKALSISNNTFIPTLVEVEGTDPNGGTGASGVSASDGVGCEELGGEFTKWLSDAFKIIQYVGVGLAIILTAVDFVQVIAGSKDDELKKAFDRSIKRLVAVVLLLLTTVLVTFITGTFIDPVVDTDIPNCVKNV